MKKNQRFRIVFLFLLFSICASFVVSAQDTFGYKADIESVNQSGFYKIQLSPFLLARSNKDLSDLRIMDEKKRFVPYIRLQNLPAIKEDFIPFPIIESSEDTDSVTSVIIENKQSLLIRSLWLKLKNTAVSRRVDLLGSDDKLKWFAIDEEIQLQQAAGSTTDSYLQSLSFPASSYKYFKINVNNKKKSPLKILQAGIYSAKTSAPEFSLLPAPSVTRKDSSDKNTYLHIALKDKFQVNKLVIPVTYPKYFRRTVLIFLINGKEKLLLSEAILDSDAEPEIVFSSKAKNLELQILNGDNPPLEIASLQAWQLNEYILAYLEPTKPYQLLVGDKNALQPDYDLKFFTDSALQHASEIKHAEVVRNPLLKTPVVKMDRDYTVILWIAIAVVLGLLSFFTWKMMGAVKGGR